MGIKVAGKAISPRGHRGCQASDPPASRLEATLPVFVAQHKLIGIGTKSIILITHNAFLDGVLLVQLAPRKVAWTVPHRAVWTKYL